MITKPKQSEFINWFGPLLDALRQLGGSGKPKEVVNQIAKTLKIPDKKLEETTKSGILRFNNQIAWARQYLVWEGYLEENTRGVWTLSPSGFKAHLNADEARAVFLKWVGIHAKSRKDKSEKEITDGRRRKSLMI